MIALLHADNRWQRETAQRLLGDRKDRSVVPDLTRQLFASKGQLALETLWALNLSGGFDAALAEKALDHPEPQVRLWTVRLLADDFRLGESIAARLARDSAD